MKLSFFDFDDTLFKLPYIENTEYMDDPNSLSQNIWEFKAKKDIIKQYKKEISKENTKVILLSNRTTNVLDSLKKFLKSHEIIFDYYLLIDGWDGDRIKSKRIEKIIKKYPKTTHIEYWEDKDKHISDVNKVIKQYSDIDLKINKIT